MSQKRCFTTLFFLSAALLFPQILSAQNTGLLQYQLQPRQTVRYRVDLHHELKLSKELPVTTRVVFQASVRIVEADSNGIATLEASAERFDIKNTLGSKETVVPAVEAAGQTVQFRVGPSGLLPGQDVLKSSSGLPWNLFLSHVFPDLTICRYLGQGVFNGQPCARIGFDLNRGKGTALLAGGHLVSAETQGSADPGYSAKSAFSSRLSLLP